MYVVFRKETPDIMEFKYDHAETKYRSVDLKKVPSPVGRASRKKNTLELVINEKANMAARQKYKRAPGVCQAKKDDLMELCEESYRTAISQLLLKPHCLYEQKSWCRIYDITNSNKSILPTASTTHIKQVVCSAVHLE